jgi:hypothetical protein
VKISRHFPFARWWAGAGRGRRGEERRRRADNKIPLTDDNDNNINNNTNSPSFHQHSPTTTIKTSDENENEMSNSANKINDEEILLAKRMFFAGCVGLPWLWICNALYFRVRVFGPCVLLDYWPGQSSLSSSLIATTDEGEDDDNSNPDSDEQRLNQQIRKIELQKWVKRSTRGAAIIIPLFVAWIIAFQVNKEHFGTKWFVMDQTEAEITGW